MQAVPPEGNRPVSAPAVSLYSLLLVLAAASGLFLIWKTAGTLLLIFAGLLFGVLLDAFTRGLEKVLPIARAWRLAIVCVLIMAAVTVLVIWGGSNLVSEADSLTKLIGEQLRSLRGELRSMGIAPTPAQGNEAPRTLTQLLFPDPGALFGTAYSAFNVASGVFGNIVLVVFIGLFTAVRPEMYRQSVLSLVPQQRRVRIGEILDEMAESLRYWLVGQLAAVILIALTTWGGLALIGMPGAFLLGLQAGIANFIPYLGPVIATIPIGLAAMAQGLPMVAWAIGVHAAIQTVEGYVLAPLIQKRAIDMPPVLTLAAVMIFGALFGAIGIALATPLVAAIRVAVLRLYVEDYLGEPA